MFDSQRNYSSIQPGGARNLPSRGRRLRRDDVGVSRQPEVSATYHVFRWIRIRCKRVPPQT
jgi:hypothetical protein